MRFSVLSLAAFLLIAFTAHGQSIGPRERNAVGIVEIVIYPSDDEPGPPKQPEKEYGTGVIVSSSGHVLTAFHLFKADTYKTCANTVNLETGETCKINFYLRGHESRRYPLTLFGRPVSGLDYITLKLPDPEDELDEGDTWPFVFFGPKPESQQLLTGAGYAEDTPPGRGTNAIKSFSGNYSPAPATACDLEDGTGFATKLLAQSEPGNSGGPVLDQRGRLVGIILGAGCETGVFAAPSTRILPIERIPDLCASVGCQYGLPGYISKREPGTTTSWQARLDGGPAAAVSVQYGVQLSVVSLFEAPTAIACVAMSGDPSALSSVQTDADAGGELANVLLANYALCSGAVPSQKAEAAYKRVKDLAEQGYEPAQPVAAWLLIKDKLFGLDPDEAFSDQLSQWERDDVERAHKYLTQAAEGGWASAQYMKAVNCRLKIVDCETSPADLKSAADQGQPDARRDLAMLQLIGNDPSATFPEFVGFSLPKNTVEGLKALHKNAMAQGIMAGKYPYWDPTSASFLAYLYGGGTYRGETLVTPNQQQSIAFEANCYSGPFQYQNPLHRYCGFFGLVARFNFANNAQVRELVKANLQQESGSTDIFGSLTSNIVLWLEYDPSIKKIACEVGTDFNFKPLGVVEILPAKTASCYFPPPTP